VSWRLLLAPAIALAVAGAGCKSKKPSEPLAQALAGLGAMPASVDQVIGLEVPRLASSPLVERALASLLAGAPDLARDLDALMAGCKLDVGRDVRRMWLGMDRAAEDRALLVVEGKLTEGQLSACVGQALVPGGGRLTGARVGGRTHFHVDQAEGRPDVWFAAVGDGVVVVASTAELLAEAAGDGPKLLASSEMAALVERAGTGHALWFAGSVPPEIGQGVGRVSGGAIGAPRAMFGHLDLDGPLDAELAVVMASADDATRGVSTIKSQLAGYALVAQAAGLGRLVNQIGAEAEGDTLFLRLKLSEEEVRALVGTAIDRPGPDDQNATPSRQGVDSDGQGDAGPGDEAPVRK
jgi:hypothetical protein